MVIMQKIKAIMKITQKVKSIFPKRLRKIDLLFKLLTIKILLSILVFKLKGR
ncbi:hypothetical protein HMPREF1410_01078 [Helicobacter pylori GAM249T]|nr:hypothetical protein HMPREF1410_01078 [Helicobacter pylori GAM249T]